MLCRLYDVQEDQYVCDTILVMDTMYYIYRTHTHTIYIYTACESHYYLYMRGLNVYNTAGATLKLVPLHSAELQHSAGTAILQYIPGLTSSRPRYEPVASARASLGPATVWKVHWGMVYGTTIIDLAIRSVSDTFMVPQGQISHLCTSPKLHIDWELS